MSSADRFSQALQHLLPQGYAWPRDPSSVLMRLLRGMAASFAELHDYTDYTAGEWLPHATKARLAEWEDAVGLPDQCFGNDQTVNARRGRVLSRLRGPSGYYSDSSPASPGAIEAICSNLGIPGFVRYNHPFRCGRDRVGRRVGQLNGQLQVILPATSEPFRVGSNRVGDRLAQRPLGAVELSCYLDRYIPARFQPIVTYTAA